jgi:hypothetical protein
LLVTARPTNKIENHWDVGSKSSFKSMEPEKEIFIAILTL